VCVCVVHQIEKLNDELSTVRQRAAEAEQKLTDADEVMRKKDEEM